MGVEKRLAASITLDQKTGSVTVDGEEFPFFLAREPIQITVEKDGLSVVRLPVLVDFRGPVLVNGEKPEPGEHAIDPAVSE